MNQEYSFEHVGQEFIHITRTSYTVISAGTVCMNIKVVMSCVNRFKYYRV
jgi:hypothetical protein